MLQTRAGHCPKCDATLPTGVDRCPECGFILLWDTTNDEHRSDHNAAASAKSAAAARNATNNVKAPAPANAFLRLFIIFVVACIATMLAVSFRARVGNQEDNPELESAHATSVQDAEEFRDQVKANQTNPDAVETTFVIGMAMPNNTDVLEITVRNEWKALDYPTRLNYAAKFVERWKTCHAPHRANLTIIDEAGHEIGGRTWNGTVWVVEKHPNARPRAKPKSQPTPAGTPAVEGTPTSTGTPAAEGTPAPQEAAPGDGKAATETPAPEATPAEGATAAPEQPGTEGQPPAADATPEAAANPEKI